VTNENYRNVYSRITPNDSLSITAALETKIAFAVFVNITELCRKRVRKICG
jgi:hypothetical protein